MTSTPRAPQSISPLRGTALYVSAVLGPGVLTLPALAAGAAGPAFLLALVALLALSVPLASTFAALGRTFPGGGGLPAHVERAFGPRAGRTVAILFYVGVPPGVAALGLFGGGYLQDVVGGAHTALFTATSLVVLTWLLNLAGLRASATLSVVLTCVLLLIVLATLLLAVPHLRGGSFTPWAPHGWTAVLPASFLLMWVLTGWEASANLADSLPPASLNRVVGTAIAIVATAFLGLSLVMVGALGVHDLGQAPVARLLALTAGPAAAALVVALALALTLGNMNAYVASLGALGASLPRARSVPGGPLTVPSVIALASLAVTAGDANAAASLVAVTAASQVPVLVAAMAAGARLLPARGGRRGAVVATAATSLLLVPAGVHLVVPLGIVAAVLALEHAGWDHLLWHPRFGDLTATRRAPARAPRPSPRARACDRP